MKYYFHKHGVLVRLASLIKYVLTITTTIITTTTIIIIIIIIITTICIYL